MIEDTVTHFLAFGLAGRRMMQGDTMSSFVAIDFETANHERDSACAVGLVTGCDGRIERVRSFLIRPPSTQFVFTDIHGLRWEDVRGAPTFGELWPALRARVDKTAFIATHNAPFTCTIHLARSQWNIYPTRLPDVCRRLDIPLRHHDASSDAEACARIVLAAQREGWRFE